MDARRTDVLPTGVTVLCVEGLETAAAVGPALLHDVALAAQHRLTLETAEVLHVPVPALRLRALVRKDDLQTERGKRGERDEDGILYHAAFL